ncbi:hypothetical protein D9M68_907390 [compost metagenome]
MAMLVRTGHKRIERLQPMRQPALHQFVQRPIHLQRRPQPIRPQPVENVIGAQRPYRMVERPQHQPLIAGQVAGNIVTMRHGFLSCRTAA